MMPKVKIAVQEADFDLAQEYGRIAQDNNDGAVVTFCGKVRDFNEGSDITSLTLEHYPGMTESVLEQICLQALQRWSINHLTVIHRVGRLDLGEQIVFIGVSSPHRGDAFSACEYLIDFLKTKAPFWKLEASEQGERWLAARDTDEAAANTWQQGKA
ncbi:molybdopterin synthase catalytic subunit MoaE [Shewanella sp. SR44-3]|uniref:molybdopterin synthase catalytic subunit MoaE n=1 Tax=Shewanella sp. SR44-3 TaxID=2760936 RepID=UPI0015FA13BA|nr:molybdopterin synthase catalytic subunit MoaE [Shewanella sp. SR44-3]MBB1268800.1 molybdopterin synthase catalytic subunit MoaE [Shewanella sp. SR44-3]